MIPYITIINKCRADEDEETTHLVMTHPKTETSEFVQIEVPLMPVQMLLIARELMNAFELNRIDNG
jgi:hypothetical protein